MDEICKRSDSTVINILNLVDRTDIANYGILNVALGGSEYFNSRNVKLFLLGDYLPGKKDINVKYINIFSKVQIRRYLKNNSLHTSNTIVVSHGCWRWPSLMGYFLSFFGYSWLVVPHGMLEEWSMGQKRIRKKLYWNLIESKLWMRAYSIRAVSANEKVRLKNVWPKGNIQIITNAITKVTFHRHVNADFGPVRFLFLSRLHRKKGLEELCLAWRSSALNNNSNFELNVVGPDDGLLDSILKLSKVSNNINIVGPLYGDAKEAMFKSNQIFILPSHSEGLPTTVLEAMSYALYPIITAGCNLKDVLDLGLAHEISSVSVNAIGKALIEVAQMSKQEIVRKGSHAQRYVSNNYSFDQVNKQLMLLYSKILQNQ